jgi:TorA maturation chaperone TorD
MSAAATVRVDPSEAQVARALARSGMYRILAQAFSYPTAGVLEELTALAVQVADMGEIAGSVRESLTRFVDATRAADPSRRGDEYVFLFDRQVRCPPYESAYGAAPQMAGKSTELADVAGFYTAFGLTPSAARPDMEDHLAAELEFMSILALKEAYARAEGHADGLAVTRSAQVTFLTDHLGRWAQTFARDLQAATPLPYYGAAAELLSTWLRAEIGELGATPMRLEDLVDPGALGEDTFTCPMVEPDGGTDPA